MRTETEVTVNILTLNASENLYSDPSGFLIKVFMSCSQVETKVFKPTSSHIKINQILKIKNILARELEFWLCTPDNKIIVSVL